jgi:hypothetical protein
MMCISKKINKVKTDDWLTVKASKGKKKLQTYTLPLHLTPALVQGEKKAFCNVPRRNIHNFEKVTQNGTKKPREIV